MSIKAIWVPGLVGLSLAYSSVSFAMPKANTVMIGYKPHMGFHQQLTPLQLQKIQPIMKETREKILPIRKEARILKIQLNGKLVTQGTSWQELSDLSAKITKLNEQIFMLKTKARYDIYQNTGLLLPKRHKHQVHPLPPIPRAAHRS
jgi:hypothetical protein